MSGSAPTPGRVLHFAYLWHREHLEGRAEATKDRPCVVLFVDAEAVPGREIVTVLPVTRQAPKRPGDALELPPPTKGRLGLDEARSWVVVTEADEFTWPGYDLRRTPDGRDDYGSVTGGQLQALRKAFAGHARRGTLARVDRGG